MKTLMLLALTLAACTDAPTMPVVHVIPWPGAEVLPEYLEGADAWVELGYRATADDPGLPECPPFWYKFGVVDPSTCQITVGVQRMPNLVEKLGASALADNASRTIIIDSRYTDWALLANAAHEFGHILLDTGHHLPAGEVGVMMASGAEWHVSTADYALACQTLGRCVTGVE